MTDMDRHTQKVVFLKQESAKARLALEKLCDKYDLDFDELIVDFDDNELIEEMQYLQKLADDYAAKVLGY